MPPSCLSRMIRNHSSMSVGGIDSDALITNCIIAENIGRDHGGGVRGSPTIKDCVITGNSVEAGRGGGLYCENGARISNCVVATNLALSGLFFEDWVDGEAAGIYCEDPNVFINQTTIVGNFAEGTAGGIYGSPTVTNSIIWANTSPNEPQMLGNPNISYSDVQGGWPGEENTHTDPCFVAIGYWDSNNTPEWPWDDFLADGDYHLKSEGGRWNPSSDSWVVDDLTSPCIDAGDLMSPVGLEPFPNGGIVNMGAYGGTAEASKSYFGQPPCETIVAGDINGDCTIDFRDFRLMALHWCKDNEP